MDRNSNEQALCYGIAEFCRDARICRSKLYDLLKEGRGPKTIKIGRRRLILVDSAQRWLDELELATRESK